MNENETTQAPENVVVVVETPLPTTKQQLITAAIGVGTLIAVPVVIAGSMAVASGAVKVYDRVSGKLSRKPKNLIIVEDSPETVED